VGGLDVIWEEWHTLPCFFCFKGAGGGGVGWGGGGGGGGGEGITHPQLCAKVSVGVIYILYLV